MQTRIQYRDDIFSDIYGSIETRNQTRFTRRMSTAYRKSGESRARCREYQKPDEERNRCIETRPSSPRRDKLVRDS